MFQCSHCFSYFFSSTFGTCLYYWLNTDKSAYYKMISKELLSFSSVQKHRWCSMLERSRTIHRKFPSGPWIVYTAARDSKLYAYLTGVKLLFITPTRTQCVWCERSPLEHNFANCVGAVLSETSTKEQFSMLNKALNGAREEGWN